MKEYIDISFIYAIAAIVGGVFYREFTKLMGFTGVTALGKVHVHFFVLGMFMFLLVALFAARLELDGLKSFRVFMWLYNIGLVLAGIMLLARGVPQVLGLSLSRAASASISGVAGIAHVLLGTGLVLLFVSLKKAAAAVKA